MSLVASGCRRDNVGTVTTTYITRVFLISKSYVLVRMLRTGGKEYLRRVSQFVSLLATDFCAERLCSGGDHI